MLYKTYLQVTYNMKLIFTVFIVFQDSTLHASVIGGLYTINIIDIK